MRVIIVGAGISGLTLAAASAQLAPQQEVEIYERDASFQGQGANTAMVDALALAELLESGNLPVDAERVAGSIAARGRKAILNSRRAAKRFHTTSRFQIMNRNFGFRVANAVINSPLTGRKYASATTSPAP